MKRKLYLKSLRNQSTVLTSTNTTLDKVRLEAQLILHEGLRQGVYYDTLGIPTIGIGFNLMRADADKLLAQVGAPTRIQLLGGEILSIDQARALFRLTVQEAVAGARLSIRNYEQLSDVRKRVVIDLVFNLGVTKWMEFVNTRKAISESRWEDAAKGLESSKWYSQVKSRGVRLVKMMRTDEDYK